MTKSKYLRIVSRQKLQQEVYKVIPEKGPNTTWQIGVVLPRSTWTFRKEKI